MSDHLTLQCCLALWQRHVTLLLVASLSSLSMAAETGFRSNPWEPSLTEKTYVLGPVPTSNRQGQPTTTFSYESHFYFPYEAPTQQAAVEKILDYQRQSLELVYVYDLAKEIMYEGPIKCRVVRKGTAQEVHACDRSGKIRVTTLKIASEVTDKTGLVTVHHPNGESYRTSVYRGKVDIDDARANRKVVKETATLVTPQPARNPLSTAQVTAVAPEPKPLPAASVQAGPAWMLEQQRLIDQLDQMDKLDLQAELDRAQACITRRDFPCSEKSLAKAARYAKGTRDKLAVAQAQASLQAEVERAREEEAERLAGLERQRLASLRARHAERCEAQCPRPSQLRSCLDGRRDPGQCEGEEESGLSVAQAVQGGLNDTLQSYGRVSQIHNDSIRQLTATLRAKEQAAQASADAAQRREREAVLRQEREAESRRSRERGQEQRGAGSSPGYGATLSAEGKPPNSSTTPPAMAKSVDANPYDKYPNYDANWGDPVAPWGGIAGGGTGKTRAEACSVVQTQTLPEYARRIESQSRGTRRVTNSSECVCRNYIPRFGWVDFFTCQVYVQFEVIKKTDRQTVDR